jgi:DNA-binding IclR family transcriptional regulator
MRQLTGEPAPGSYETSHDEVIPGLSSVAVPLAAPGQHPAALAVVYLTQPADAGAIGARLERAANAIRERLT